MKWVAGTATQTANDTLTKIEIPTSLGVVDQKTIWEIYALQCMNNTPAVTAVTPWTINFSLAASETDAGFGQAGEIATISWSVIKSTNAASPQADTTAVLFHNKLQDFELYVPYQFANSKLWIQLASTGTSQKATIAYKIYYEEKKVSEVDFYKLQSGWCTC